MFNLGLDTGLQVYVMDGQLVLAWELLQLIHLVGAVAFNPSIKTISGSP